MKKRTILFLIPTVFFILLLCYSVVRALLILIPQKQEQNTFHALKQSALAAKSEEPAASEKPSVQPANSSPDESETTAATEYRYALLLEQNPQFVGWLSIADTGIDYPVMKSSEDDPEYYLRRDFYGKESYSGCLFVGGGCDTDSESFIIYGHNMNNDAMFGTLDEYIDYDFAAGHPDVTFAAPDGIRVYRVFAAFQTRVFGEDEDVFKYYEQIGELGEAEYNETVRCARDMATTLLPYAPEYPQQLLFLSTCSYHTDDGRFVVAAYRIK